jgi:hypothetical protein
MAHRDQKNKGLICSTNDKTTDKGGHDMLHEYYGRPSHNLQVAHKPYNPDLFIIINFVH